MLINLRNVALAALVLACGSTARAAENYAVDVVHSSISFMISHQRISNIHGRFNDFSGTFAIDKEDPTKSSYSLSVKIDSIDTNNQKRDEHLKAPDYFNAKQFPAMTFQSTKVKAVEGGFDVTGDLTLHGVKKSIVVPLRGGKFAEFPKGKQRVGYTSTLVIKRTDFDMKTALEGLGDEVTIILGIEAAKE